MGILLAALVATVIAVWVGSTLLRDWSRQWRFYYGLAGVCLVLSPLINLLVKKPAVGLMLGQVHLPPKPSAWPWWFGVFVLVLVGVSEETIKLVPLLSRRVRRAASDRQSAVPLAFAIGLGFAVGEIWYLAHRISVNEPATAKLPFYLLGGFVTERVATLSIHSSLVLLPIRGWAGGTTAFLRGTAVAILLHATFDVMAMLYQMKVVGAGTAMVFLLVLTVACALPFYRYGGKAAPDPSAALRQGGRTLYRADSLPSVRIEDRRR